ncbi:ABC transporter permease [uncultured Friedmanniella sp.]|uniref:ABC transporter permease n=1 Tax=uncultured Friedmanniella sp. TaxID=335381 RepID=UPI0035CBD492
MSATLVTGAPVAETASNASVATAVLRRLGSSLLVVVLALVVLALVWAALLKLFDVSSFVGKTPLDVYHYLFTDRPARGIRPTSITAEAARADMRAAWLVTLVDAGIGFVTGLVIATAIAIGFLLVKPFEFAFMPIAMLLRSVPLVALAPVLLLIVGQGKLGIATIAAIVVLFPALVNIVLGLRSASPLAVDLIRVNGGGAMKEMLMVRLPAALPSIFASVRISVPGAIVGAMLAEWLSGFTGLGGVLSAYKGRGNFGGVWAIVVVSVATSIVGYAVAAVVESAALAAWGPNAGKR